MRGHGMPPVGIIPACAGNTSAHSSTCATSGDHPRMCGEHMSSSLLAPCLSGSSPHVRGTPTSLARKDEPSGSSPHVRGTLIVSSQHMPDTRIIPACAGNTYNLMFDLQPLMGSSPHVRGTLVLNWNSTILSGIIPACAGNTRSTTAASWRTRDHPRMCGEHLSVESSVFFLLGSSPHVRGTRRTVGR